MREFGRREKNPFPGILEMGSLHDVQEEGTCWGVPEWREPCSYLRLAAIEDRQRCHVLVMEVYGCHHATCKLSLPNTHPLPPVEDQPDRKKGQTTERAKGDCKYTWGFFFGSPSIYCTGGATLYR